MKFLLLLAMCTQHSASDVEVNHDSPPGSGTFKSTDHSVEGPRLNHPASTPELRNPPPPRLDGPMERPVFHDDIDPPPQQPAQVTTPGSPSTGPSTPILPNPQPFSRLGDTHAETEGSGYWWGFAVAIFLGVIAVLAACFFWDQHFKRQQRTWQADRDDWKSEALSNRKENDSLRDTIIRKIDHVFNTGDGFNVEMEVTNDGAKASCGKRELQPEVVVHE